MTREIKFRAWDKVNKIMIYRVVVGTDFEFDRHKIFVYELEPFKDSVGSYPNENLIPMQYTGLKDKNGKDIYEGDIILSREVIYLNKKGVVEFIEGSWIVFEEFLFDFHPNELEVIGNIYETPELLKEIEKWTH